MAATVSPITAVLYVQHMSSPWRPQEVLAWTVKQGAAAQCRRRHAPSTTMGSGAMRCLAYQGDVAKHPLLDGVLVVDDIDEGPCSGLQPSHQLQPEHDQLHPCKVLAGQVMQRNARSALIAVADV